MPSIDLDAIENHLRAAREEERRVNIFYFIPYQKLQWYFIAIFLNKLLKTIGSKMI